jgi:DNA polymerase-3 subunit epsilon
MSKNPIEEAAEKVRDEHDKAMLDILEGKLEPEKPSADRLEGLRLEIAFAETKDDTPDSVVSILDRQRVAMQRALGADIRRGLRRPLVFFDMETTGLDTVRDRIVELAAVKVFPLGEDGSERPEEELSLLIDPEMPISPEATAVHGIDDARVAGCPIFADVAPRIREFLEGCDLSGFNIKRFDLPMLLGKLRDHGCPLDVSKDGDALVVDACDIFHRKEPRTLEAALRFYTGLRHRDKHVAMADVRATMAVLDAQLARYPDLPRDIRALHEEFHDKDAIDLSGKLRMRHGIPCINFGKYRGKPLASMQSSYIRWMIDEHVVSDDALPMLREILALRAKDNGKGE